MVKDKKVIIYNETEIQDDIGNWVTAYQPIHPGSAPGEFPYLYSIANPVVIQ